MMKKTLIAIVFIFVACFSFFRCSNVETYTIVSGRVTAEDTGKGIAGVHVVTHGGLSNHRHHEMVETNEEGRYVIKNLLSGAHYLHFYPPEISPYVEHSVQVYTGKQPAAVNQVLKLGGSISGTVFDNDGKTPVSGIRMIGECEGDSDAEKVHKSGDTDSNGHYLLNGFMESNKCNIEISEGQRFNINRDVSVKKGYTTKVDFSLAYRTTGISGFVTFSDNTIPPPIEIVLKQSDKISHTYTDKYGRYFIVGVPPGTYEVQVNFVSGKTPIKQTVTVVVEKRKTTDVSFVIPVPGEA